MLLLAILVLQPALDEAGPLRLVATGTGEAEVHWNLDGADVAVTRDGEATVVEASAGEHVLFARSDTRQAWRALARAEPARDGAAVLVPAWTAEAPGTAQATAVRRTAPQDGRSFQAADLAPAVGTGALLALAAGVMPSRRRPGGAWRAATMAGDQAAPEAAPADAATPHAPEGRLRAWRARRLVPWSGRWGARRRARTKRP